MGEVLMPVLVIAGYGVLMGALGWLMVRARRRQRAGGGDVLGAFDEIWHPAAHRPRIEIQQQAQREDPAPAPGDPAWSTPTDHR